MKIDCLKGSRDNCVPDDAHDFSQQLLTAFAEYVVLVLSLYCEQKLVENVDSNIEKSH